MKFIVFNEYEAKFYRDLIGYTNNDIKKAKKDKKGLIYIRYDIEFYLSKKLRTI